MLWRPGAYANLYDRVMPEVTQIEKAFPGPDGVAASLKTYPELRAQAQKDLKTFASAITAAEKASPRPISEYGGAQVKSRRGHPAGRRPRWTRRAWPNVDELEPARRLRALRQDPGDQVDHPGQGAELQQRLGH
ncbi:hypothetical protein ACRAWD_28660 [Caulobacter segnis]